MLATERSVLVIDIFTCGGVIIGNVFKHGGRGTFNATCCGVGNARHLNATALVMRGFGVRWTVCVCEHL